MSSKVICLELSVPWFQVNALAFIPSPDKTPIKSEWALFSHGYTSHKGDCLNWATRLVEAGVPCMIFDQPGHYLGSFHEIASFEDFKENDAIEFKNETISEIKKILNSISNKKIKKCIEKKYFSDENKTYTSIAQEMNVTVQTVINWHNKFIKLVKQKLNSQNT